MLPFFVLAAALVGCGTGSEKPKVPDIFREQLMRFLETSGELKAATGQGLNIGQMKEKLARVKSSFELIDATWPADFAPDARLGLKSAIEGWDLASILWQGRIDDLDEPTEPNVNQWMRYKAYYDSHPECRFKIEVHLYPPKYEGRRYVSAGDQNVRLLFSSAAGDANKAKSQLLAALSAN